MFTTNREFEDEVRRVARLLWPSAQFDGAAMMDGRERDGIFETEDIVNIVECTVSRAKDKATEDCGKIEKLIKKLTPRYSHKLVRGWFITLNEPTADQRTVVKRSPSHRIETCSFDQFRSRLVDARSYLTLRQSYAFGSVRDPQSGSHKFDPKYIELDILDDQGTIYSTDTLVNLLDGGRTVVLAGDYGAGKSSTSRELFIKLSNRFWSNKSKKFPVILNLRDHHGQTDSVEALERHARRIGFTPESSLVRAWRAGLVTILLDGFDEIASAGWAGKTTKLRDLRYRSMELVRRFAQETPTGSGLVLAGRAHFFDNQRELYQALGIRQDTLLLTISEFNLNQVQSFLSRSGWKGSIPEWLPTRPLLLAYLVARGLLPTSISEELSLGPVVGWDDLLHRISEREAEIEAGIDSGTVRRLIEQLASLARGTIDGLGPLTPDVIMSAFKDVCGYPPDDKGAVLLQRLPGLGSSQSEDGSRYFIDRDFAQAAKGGALFRYIDDPFASNLRAENWQSTLGSLGHELAAHKCASGGHGKGKILAAIETAYKDKRLHILCADLLLVLMQSGYSYEGTNIYLSGIWVTDFSLDESVDMRLVELQDSVIAFIDVSYELQSCCIPTFRRCHIGRVAGRTGPDDVPSDKFPECTFYEFENTAETTSAILNLELPLSTRVMLTILKKVFAQSGRGRKESALYRGLDTRAQQLVGAVLQLLKRENLVVRLRQGTDTVWLPTKTGEARKRALKLLTAPATSNDALIVLSKEIE